MSNLVLPSLWRFLGLLLFQGLILRRMAFDGPFWEYIHAFIYPLAIILLPLSTPRGLVIILGFAAGLITDFFYFSWGVHASAATFLAYVRPLVLSLLEPRGGYNANYSPTQFRLGRTWFLSYSASMMGAFLLFYFSVEAFTFVYILDILLNSAVSFVFSMFFVLVFQRLFNPQD